MKTTFLLIFAMVFAFAACDDDDSNNTNNVNNVNNTTTTNNVNNTTTTNNVNNTTTTNNVNNGSCGDGVLDAGEVCDGDDFGTETCESLGYAGGTLSCSLDCSTILDGWCYINDTCGDGVADYWESCDGDDLQDYTCEDWGFSGGTLGCTDDCSFDLSACTGDLCSLQEWYDDGYCDPCELYGGVEDTADCSTICTTSDGECGSYYDSALGGTTCMYYAGTEDPDCGAGDSMCGDGVADDYEWCDGTELNVACEDLGFAGGSITCAPNCTPDVSECTEPVCGNDVVEGTETCDGTDFNGATCEDAGYTGGTLICNASCAIEYTDCTATCGDGIISTSETCDGTDFGTATCVTEGFTGGDLACDLGCQIDTTGCTSN